MATRLLEKSLSTMHTSSVSGVVLVEVGEEQMAAAGVAALTGQVHGGTGLATPVRRGEDEETPPEGCAPQPRPPRPRRIPAGPLFT